MGLRLTFLIDSVGALVSAIMLSVVLPMFIDKIGMPEKVLILLGGIAWVFAVYSGYGYLSGRNGEFLRAIAIANLVYCGLTAALVCYWYLQLTQLGLAYFIIEMCIVVCLAIWEWKVSFSKQK